MLGLEKRVDAIRQMQGAEDVEPETPARNSARTGIMLALVGILAAAAVYIAVEGKYSAKMNEYESKLAALDSRLAEAVNAPRDMARKVIATNTLGEVSQKVDSLKGQLDASYQERLAKVDELIKSMQKDVSK